jgi:hypothetical protein
MKLIWSTVAFCTLGLLLIAVGASVAGFAAAAILTPFLAIIWVSNVGAAHRIGKAEGDTP